MMMMIIIIIILITTTIVIFQSLLGILGNGGFQIKYLVLTVVLKYCYYVLFRDC